MPKIYENQQATEFFIQLARDKMAQGKRYEEPVHASALTTCTRQSVLKDLYRPGVAGDEIPQLASGFALQEWYWGAEDDGDLIRLHADGSFTNLGAYNWCDEEHECDDEGNHQLVAGEPYAPPDDDSDYDFICSTDGQTKNTVLEFKTTKSYNPNTYAMEEEWLELVKINKRTGRRSGFAVENKLEWLRRCALYCKVFGKKKAHVAIHFRMADVLRTFTLEFTQEELDEAIPYAYGRLKTITDARTTEIVPPVTTRSEDWECRYCPFLSHGCLDKLKAADMSVPEFNDKAQIRIDPKHG